VFKTGLPLFVCLPDKDKVLVLIEVKQVDPADPKTHWGLYVNGILIGTSKNRFDADYAKVMLEKALAASPPDPL
jgi:hypothetical protein